MRQSLWNPVFIDSLWPGQAQERRRYGTGGSLVCCNKTKSVRAGQENSRDDVYHFNYEQRQSNTEIRVAGVKNARRVSSSANENSMHTASDEPSNEDCYYPDSSAPETNAFHLEPHCNTGNGPKAQKNGGAIHDDRPKGANIQTERVA